MVIFRQMGHVRHGLALAIIAVDLRIIYALTVRWGRSEAAV